MRKLRGFNVDGYLFNESEITFDEFFDIIEISLYSAYIKKHHLFKAIKFNSKKKEHIFYLALN